jgi:hypothetical protein
MPSGLSQHEKALAWARSKVGQHEQPMGSNSGIFVRSCQAATWLGGTGWPWCVAYFVKAWTVAERNLPYKGAGAYEFLRWHQQHLPGWVKPLEKARPGAAVIINTGSGHLAMLNKEWKKGDKHVNTVNGNVHDSVDYVDWPVSLVRGVVDPPEDIGKVPPAKPPRYEIVTSESGHTVLVVSGRPYGQLVKFLPKVLRNHRQITIRRSKRK